MMYAFMNIIVPIALDAERMNIPLKNNGFNKRNSDSSDNYSRPRHKDYGGVNNRDNKYNGRNNRSDNSPKMAENEPEGLIVGRNPVTEALKAGKPIDIVYINPDAGGSISVISRLARERNVVVKSVGAQKLTQMCGGMSHQGVIASGACAEYVGIEDILAVSRKKRTKPFIIVCDEIEDPHNLGAIIRTAEAAGADGLIIPKRRSASLNATVFKTSAGAAVRLPVAKVANLPAALDELKKNGVWIFGTDAKGDSCYNVDFKGAAAIVIGSEGFGLGRLVKEKCDFLLSLPMNGEITSLNASVAAGIFMYEAVRQRNGL